MSGVGAKAETLGDPISIHEASWLLPGHAGTPALDPGLIELRNDAGAGPVAVKHPRYRTHPELRRLPGVYTGDCIRLVNSIYEAPYPVGYGRLHGVEVELNSVEDDSGKPFNLYPNDIPLPIPGLAEHPELYRNTLETDGEPKNSTSAAYDSVADSIAGAEDGLEPFGALIDPASARMQDVPGPEDVSPNPYVQTMYDVLGPQILKFLATGVHEHWDMHVGLLPVVTRYLRVLGPYLNLGLLAAPFGFGEQTPRLGEILDHDDLRPYDGQQPHSVRYPVRFGASPDGGVGLLVAHSTLPSALAHADQELAAGRVSNPARHYGSHSDVRPRYDVPSARKLWHPGRVELCVKDTAALRFETLKAYGELTRAVLEQLERVAMEGEAGIARLHRDFPQLFGPAYKDDTFAAQQLARAHQNSIAISYSGADAEVTNGVGRKVVARDQLNEVVRFATQNGITLPRSVLHHLFKSTRSAERIEPTMRQFKDQHGLPSLIGYYITGMGTAAQWMIGRSRAAAERGITPTNNMRLGTLDRAHSFKRYLKRYLEARQ
jgi:hypothetical protein